MESFKISNLVTKMLFSPGKTRKLINGESLFFEKKTSEKGRGLLGAKEYVQENKGIIKKQDKQNKQLRNDFSLTIIFLPILIISLRG